MPPIIVHQAKEYSQYIHYNIPLDWKFHHISYGYMDIDGWLKAMTQFSNVCGASPVNNHILFFDVHDSHFGCGALRKIVYKKVQPFVLESGDSINYHPNDNGPNAKLKSLYNVANSRWVMKYGVKRFSPHHMNSVFV